MRIIAGKYKRRLIDTIESQAVRPTTDRVRTTVFNLLQTRFDYEGKAVLDLYAGSGILGFEAMSRGAASVLFVEKVPDVAMKIEESKARLGLAVEAQIFKGSATRFLEETPMTFDLIFADPPYKTSDLEFILDKVFNRNLLNPDGLLILEHHESKSFVTHEKFLMDKSFGITKVSFFKQPDETQP
jgi:16S rRNA (guanine966-N2)-methyltransferase